MSPYHGLRGASSKSVLRTLPLEVRLTGLPESVKREEILTSINVTIRNNMPIKVNVTTILTSEGQKLRINQSPNQVSHVELDAYQRLVTSHSIKAGTGDQLLIQAEVIASAVIAGRVAEVEAIQVEKAVKIVARGEIRSNTISNYFCTEAQEEKKLNVSGLNKFLMAVTFHSEARVLLGSSLLNDNYIITVTQEKINVAFTGQQGSTKLRYIGHLLGNGFSFLRRHAHKVS